MKNKKIKVAVLFGGKSAEHAVSIESAKNVMNALDTARYEIIPVKIEKDGTWQKDLIEGVDVVFPVLHGTYGEDGLMQGFLEIADVPYVGSGVLGSAIGMDKDVTKRLLWDAGLPVAKFLVFRKGEQITFDRIKKELGLPFFIKPANLGSSVGVTKVKEQAAFSDAIKQGFSYDTKIIVEEYIPGQEIECSVLGNENPQASLPGEIIVHHEFYDYSAKYLDENGSDLKIPAELSSEKIKEIQELALETFKVLCLEGMARIDFFLGKNGKVYISEANTIPGFTNHSMYPKMWEASGLSDQQLVEKLLQLAIERYASKQKLKTTFKTKV